jgi:hypothetical protein
MWHAELGSASLNRSDQFFMKGGVNDKTFPYPDQSDPYKEGGNDNE